MTTKTSILEFLKKLIIATADKYIEDRQINVEQINLIDDFADYMLDNIDTLTQNVGKIK